MDLLKLTFHILILTECYYSTKAMGLCDFADKFPCEDNGGSVCFKNTGCHNVVPDKRPSPVHVTTANATPDQVTSGQAAIDQATADQVTTGYATTDQVTIGHVKSDQVTTGHATTDQVTTTPLCPLNMVYANCTTCQGTCGDPERCISNCTEPETCVCYDVFLFKGDDCVHEKQCGCFIEGKGVIPTNETHVNIDCSEKCACENGVLNCNSNYACSSNATCGVNDGVRQCSCNKGCIGDGETCCPVYRDCHDLYLTGHRQDGVYAILPAKWPGSPFNVACDMTTAGGGWTVFQRRINGSVDFDLYWPDYKEGFGNPSHEVWLGNDKLHILTDQRNYELRIDLVDRYGVPYYANYNYFSISNETNNYRLTLGTYSEGNAGDSFSYNNGNDFTTRDRDNDNHAGINCATECACRSVSGCGDEKYRGAWWYSSCSQVALNNLYARCCFEWLQLPNNFYIKYTEMKLRPI